MLGLGAVWLRCNWPIAFGMLSTCPSSFGSLPLRWPGFGIERGITRSENSSLSSFVVESLLAEPAERAPVGALEE